MASGRQGDDPQSHPDLEVGHGAPSRGSGEPDGLGFLGGRSWIRDHLARAPTRTIGRRSTFSRPIRTALPDSPGTVARIRSPAVQLGEVSRGPIGHQRVQMRRTGVHAKRPRSGEGGSLGLAGDVKEQSGRASQEEAFRGTEDRRRVDQDPLGNPRRANPGDEGRGPRKGGPPDLLEKPLDRVEGVGAVGLDDHAVRPDLEGTEGGGQLPGDRGPRPRSRRPPDVQRERSPKGSPAPRPSGSQPRRPAVRAGGTQRGRAAFGRCRAGRAQPGPSSPMERIHGVRAETRSRPRGVGSLRTTRPQRR